MNTLFSIIVTVTVLCEVISMIQVLMFISIVIINSCIRVFLHIFLQYDFVFCILAAPTVGRNILF